MVLALQSSLQSLQSSLATTVPPSSLPPAMATLAHDHVLKAIVKTLRSVLSSCQPQLESSFQGHHQQDPLHHSSHHNIGRC